MSDLSNVSPDELYPPNDEVNMHSYQHDDDTLPLMPHEAEEVNKFFSEQQQANEEGHYWSTLKDFQELIKIRDRNGPGICYIMDDLDDDAYNILKNHFKLCP